MKEAFTNEGLKAFNESRLDNKGNKKPPVYKLKIYYSNKEDKISTLQRLYENNDKLSVKTGDNYLFIVMEKAGKTIFDIVSLYDAAQIAKDEWKIKNKNFKQRICENYLKLNKADKVLFIIQQNDLVYLPENIDDPVINFTNEEFKLWISEKENKINFNKRVYKVIKFTGNDCSFILNTYASTIDIPRNFSEEEWKIIKETYGDKKIPNQIKNFAEFGSNGNSSKFIVNKEYIESLLNKKSKYKPIKVIETCIKIKSDWLGNIIKTDW